MVRPVAYPVVRPVAYTVVRSVAYPVVRPVGYSRGTSRRFYSIQKISRARFSYFLIAYSPRGLLMLDLLYTSDKIIIEFL